MTVQEFCENVVRSQDKIWKRVDKEKRRVPSLDVILEPCTDDDSLRRTGRQVDCQLHFATKWLRLRWLDLLWICWQLAPQQSSQRLDTAEIFAQTPLYDKLYKFTANSEQVK